jgi:hypothetical protein
MTRHWKTVFSAYLPGIDHSEENPFILFRLSTLDCREKARSWVQSGLKTKYFY